MKLKYLLKFGYNYVIGQTASNGGSYLYNAYMQSNIAARVTQQQSSREYSGGWFFNPNPYDNIQAASGGPNSESGNINNAGNGGSSGRASGGSYYCPPGSWWC